MISLILKAIVLPAMKNGYSNPVSIAVVEALIEALKGW